MGANKTNLELQFYDIEAPELVKTVFFHPKLERKMIALRTTGLLPRGVGSFKWSQCSKALALFFVKAKLILDHTEETAPILDGYRLSPASSLGSRLWKADYAWIHDIFGTDSNGLLLLRQLIYGINVRHRRKGPVQIF